jgi:glycosyltransferase involved in cell wall biosynthesis
MLVYPSHYEGFGLPVADALALGKPVVVLESTVNRELENLTRDPNLHLVRTVQDLQRVIAQYYDRAGSSAPDLPVRRWSDAAAEYAQHFREILSHDINVDLLRKRWDTLRDLDAAEPLEPVPLGLSAAR